MEEFGLFDSPLIYDYYIPNQNQFRNQYRIGFEQSKALGWKPTNEWTHLIPQNNEVAGCSTK